LPKSAKLRIATAVILVVAMVLIASGASYEALARRQLAHDFPPAGRLIDIGGRRIQLDCRGAGSPTAVFISGLDTFGSESWSMVQGTIAATTRTCSYSRAGMLWSDPGPEPRDGRATALDLQAALSRAGERPPFVLVGHSSGALYSMIYTHLFPAQVSGLVFVDGSHPDQLQRFSTVVPTAGASPERFYRLRMWLAWTGINRVGRSHAAAPQSAHEAYVATSRFAVDQETAATRDTFAQAGAARDLGSRPLYVLTSTMPYSPAVLAAWPASVDQGRRLHEVWQQLHDDEATWSIRSRHELVPDSDHYIQLHRPDAVVRGVLWVVGEVRDGAP
jgi:pimeloyl-ACP methyl ester carboxylesterase